MQTCACRSLPMCATKETCNRIRPLALEIIGFRFFQRIHQTCGIVPASSLLSSLFICCSCHGFLEPGQVNHSILVRLLCVLIIHLQPAKGPELLQNCIISLRILVTGVSSFRMHRQQTVTWPTPTWHVTYRQKFSMNSNPIKVDHLQFSRAPHDIWIWKGEDKANNASYQGAERHFAMKQFWLWRGAQRHWYTCCHVAMRWCVQFLKTTSYRNVEKVVYLRPKVVKPCTSGS
jgi:hypothetical protein